MARARRFSPKDFCNDGCFFSRPQCSAKNCRIAFHVTCGLHAGLEMTTLLTQDDEVKFKSYCPKHSGLEGSDLRERDSDGEGEKEEGAGSKKGKRRGRVRGEEEEDSAAAQPAAAAASTSSSSSSPSSLCLVRQRDQQDNRVNLRKMKLQEMEEVFYQFVDAEEVGRHLKMAPETVDFLFQYWKLKRKANYNQPLLTPKKDEEDSLARREHEVLLRRLQLFTHLRQDLERVGDPVRVKDQWRGSPATGEDWDPVDRGGGQPSRG